jgi:hypothetical protein
MSRIRDLTRRVLTLSVRQLSKPLRLPLSETIM